MTTESNQSENPNESNGAEPTLAETVGVVRASLERLGIDEPTGSRCEARIDETGRFWLADPETDNAYLWTRDVEEVRC